MRSAQTAQELQCRPLASAEGVQARVGDYDAHGVRRICGLTRIIMVNASLSRLQMTVLCGYDGASGPLIDINERVPREYLPYQRCPIP
jgi:hypothetical protein